MAKEQGKSMVSQSIYNLALSATTQLATAGMNLALGGTYDRQTGGFGFKDKTGDDLTYGDKLGHFANFAGNFAANLGTTYLANKITKSNQFSTSATLLSGGDIGNLLETFGVKGSFTKNLKDQNMGMLSIGLMGKDSGKLQAGGGNIDLSLSNVSKVIGDINAVAFQLTQEDATITAVNQSFLYGNEKMRKQAQDIFSFSKRVVYDQDESKGEYGEADTDGSTIHLSWQMKDSLESGKRENLGKALSTMGREGSLLDLHSQFGNQWSGETYELAASQMQMNMVEHLQQQGINFGGSEKDQELLAKMSNFANTGDGSDFVMDGYHLRGVIGGKVGILDSKETALKNSIAGEKFGIKGDKDQILFMTAFNLATGNNPNGFSDEDIKNIKNDKDLSGIINKKFKELQVLNKDNNNLNNDSAVVISEGAITESKDFSTDKYIGKNSTYIAKTINDMGGYEISQGLLDSVSAEKDYKLNGNTAKFLASITGFKAMLLNPAEMGNIASIWNQWNMDKSIKDQYIAQLMELSEANIKDTGKAVIGPYNPEKVRYTVIADKMDASYFSLGEEWDKCEKLGIDPWKFNKNFLDKVSEMNQQIFTTIPRAKIGGNNYLTREVGYLINKKGYKWFDQYSLKKE